MLNKVEAYRCPNGALETDPLRAFAWKLSSLSPDARIDFSVALWIMGNKDIVKKVIEAFEKEIL